MQDYDTSSVLAMEILQSCTNPLNDGLSSSWNYGINKFVFILKLELFSSLFPLLFVLSLCREELCGSAHLLSGSTHMLSGSTHFRSWRSVTKAKQPAWSKLVKIWSFEVYFTYCWIGIEYGRQILCVVTSACQVSNKSVNSWYMYLSQSLRVLRFGLRGWFPFLTPVLVWSSR